MQEIQRRSVFVSHSSKDLKLAQQIVSFLETSGVSCWVAPRDVPPGSSYGEQITSAIEQCSLVLLVLTEASNKSIAVAQEIERAFSYQRTIVPLRMRNIPPSKKLEFFVASSQWVDAFASPLKERLAHVAAVVQAIEMHSSQPTMPPEHPTLAGKVARFFEGFSRNPLPYAMGSIGLLALGIIAGFSMFFGSAIKDNLDSGAKNKIEIDKQVAEVMKQDPALCAMVMPLRPKSVTCTMDLIDKIQGLQAEKNDLISSAMNSSHKLHKPASWFGAKAQEFESAVRHGNLSVMEKILMDLHAASGSTK